MFEIDGLCEKIVAETQKHRTSGEGGGGGISLTPLCYFHLLYRHLDVSRAITAETSPLHIASSQLQVANSQLQVANSKLLTSKLRVLCVDYGAAVKLENVVVIDIRVFHI